MEIKFRRAKIHVIIQTLLCVLFFEEEIVKLTRGVADLIKKVDIIRLDGA